MADDRPGNPQLNLRIPDRKMFAALMRDATKKKMTVQAVIWEIVAAHYSVEVMLPARGRPKKSVDECRPTSKVTGPPPETFNL